MTKGLRFYPYRCVPLLVLLCTVLLTACAGPATTAAPAINNANAPAVVAYYTGDGEDLKNYNVNQITHIIFSFVHLKGNRAAFDNAQAIAAYQRLVALKNTYPQLRVKFALGGWKGCSSCSKVFSSAANRRVFAQSVSALLDQYGGDGIDLDWEYPAIAGPPGDLYQPQDKNNFTALVKQLRKTLGSEALISFAAGGFPEYLKNSVDWRAVMPYVNSVNLMSYDLVNGFSKITGHHTALYATVNQAESADAAIHYLLKQQVPANKIVMGSAFYARQWKNVGPTLHGRYQTGEATASINFAKFNKTFTKANGWYVGWDSQAQAPYAYNAQQKLYATFDNKRSIRQKVNYIKKHALGGIMFWQLNGDKTANGLLDTIAKTLKGTD